MATNQIIGLEALIRWNSPNGMVPPDSFIAIAEESGSDYPNWGMGAGERLSNSEKNWQPLGYQTPIAVNLSTLQFKAPLYLVN